MSESPRDLLAVTEDELAQKLSIPDEVRKKFDSVMLRGDWMPLTEEERSIFLRMQCARAGVRADLNPIEFFETNGKLKPYMNKGCAEQLRAIHGLTASIAEKQIIEGMWIVQIRVEGQGGRCEDDVGTAPANDPQGLKKAITQAKRRATLAFCGMGALDIGDENGSSDGPKRVTPTPIDPNSRVTIVPTATESAPIVPRPQALPSPNTPGVAPPVAVPRPAIPRPKA